MQSPIKCEVARKGLASIDIGTQRKRNNIVSHSLSDLKQATI